jgi:tRNA pseudouridine32 synthase/23S rRNA pseudouridine746 synthase
LNTSVSSLFTKFKSNIKEITLPNKFTFPFDYIPHKLTQVACKELQTHLQTQTGWKHDFGLHKNPSETSLGKMFGVLVVQNPEGELGYLSAFSGILANKTILPHFVPPIFDRKQKSSFYIQIENELNQLTKQISVLETSSKFIQLKKAYQANLEESKTILSSKKAALKNAKKKRKNARTVGLKELPLTEYEKLVFQHQKESLQFDVDYKQTAKKWNIEIDSLEKELYSFQTRINQLKEERKAKSSLLQKSLFNEYQLQNANGKTKGVIEIFEDLEKSPPAGTGDCAAPKLLQYAFLNQLKPIALAEFWWGKSPKLEVRKHGHFYPSCKTKCAPILAHMLQGLEVDVNPVGSVQTAQLGIKTLFEDEYLLVISKPAELLSVPGKKLKDSVETRMKQQFSNATGPMLAHRLDMSTSGIMLISKSLEVHQKLQKQFTNRTIKKRYLAILDGNIEEDSGEIELPLRVDIDNRPTQIVDFEHGKKAITHWEVISKRNNQTRIHFYPITGRTHQLRVHASHPLGLNTPILGDELYGTRTNRLHLQANSIEFTHPITQEIKTFKIDPEF